MVPRHRPTSATQVTFLGPLSPLTAAVVGWAALGQTLTPVQLAGMALAFGATVAGQLRPGGGPSAPRTPRRAATEPAPVHAPRTVAATPAPARHG